MNLPSDSAAIYNQAKSQKQAILTEMASIESKQSQLKQRLADIEGMLRTFASWGMEPHDEIPDESATHPRKHKPAKQKQVALAASEILSGGQILNTDQLLDELAAKGISIGGENPAGNLSAILSKTPQVCYSRAAKGWMQVSVPSEASS